MTAKNAFVVDKPKREIASVAPSTSTAVMALIERAALDPAFDVAKMEALLKVKERLDAEEARKAFVRALAEFKAEAPSVKKRKQVRFKTDRGETAYKHATLGDTVAIVAPHLSKFGFSTRWKAEQKEGKITVTCILTHELGHSESVTLEAPYDVSGGKNAIQAIISAKSYLERHTLMAVTGLAAQDEDDDGRSSGKPAPEKKGEPIPPPKEDKKAAKEEPAPTKGKDTFTIKIDPDAPMLVGKPDKVEFRGPSAHQKYRIDPIVAKTAKANFKDGDTAIVTWEIKDGIKWVVDLDRKASDPSQF